MKLNWQKRAAKLREQKAIRLNVSVASHSELMRESANLFSSILEGVNISSPQFKIYQNADAIAIQIIM